VPIIEFCANIENQAKAKELLARATKVELDQNKKVHKKLPPI
jgi:hypothetical protein